ncbi:hypothetical protein FACS1894216_22370 [Synergistales bacterium]|nr:hypothetical protein FACS1894216_22370 [Synergistales bacterium]
MRESDWRDFCSLIHLADDAAKNTKRDEKTVAFMFEVLMPYEFKGIRRAVIEYIREDKFAVAPSDIIRRIDGTPAEQSLAAWRLFLYTLERYGYYDSVRFPSPAYHFVIKCLGGWEQVYEVYGSLPDQELQFRAKEWRTLFEIGTGVRKLSWDDVPGYLAGYFERQNSSHGFGDYIPEPIDVMTGETLNREELTGGTDKNPMLKFVKGLRNEDG